jgi:2-polyprenyl-3-methyl-5-hydroxy-6-metoxy-1,4-benzoquinol methylase
MKDCVEIKECIACGSKDLVPVLDLGFQPLANSYKKDPWEVEQTFPLAINRCEHCYHVQLTHKVNPELMFKDYAYVSGTAKTQLEYFNWFVGYITEKYGKTPKSVLDIGCNDGSFLNAWGGTGVKTYGVDPAENLYPVSSKHHSVECGFFTGKEFGSKKFDVITCMNAFAHNADQLELLKNVRQRLSDDGLMFATTSQANMILNGEFDTIYHEHLSFYNIKSAKALCERAGLNLVDVYKHPIHGTSYIFVISKNPLTSSNFDIMFEEEKLSGLYLVDTYKKYAEDCYMIAEKFRNVIINHKERMIPVIGYGAPAKGNTLMNFAKQMPEFTIEDNPLKQGLFTPGVGCPIKSPEYLQKLYGNTETVCFVPLAWNFYDEIVSKIKTLRPEKKDIFVRYFPTFEVN